MSDLPAILGGQPIRPQGPPDWPINDPAIEAALAEAYSSGDWGRYHAGYCSQLSDALKDVFGCELIQLCSSGTSAVELALIGCRVGKDDEVIMAAYDYKANFQDIVALGAKPVLVDINQTDGQLNCESLASAFSDRTKAVLCSHLHGGIVDIPQVMHIASEHNTPVIEDACQATGATIFGRPAGMWGNVGVVSFGGSKLLTAGRGGAVFGSSPEIMQRIRLHEFRGNHSYPLSQIQAAVLIPQVQQLQHRNQIRMEAVHQLANSLPKNSPLSLLSDFQSDCVPAWYKVGFRYQEPVGGLNRETFCKAMRAEGFALDPAFRALNLTHSQRRFRAVGELTNASLADQQFVTLHHPVLLEGPVGMNDLIDALARVVQYAERIREQTSEHGASEQRG